VNSNSLHLKKRLGQYFLKEKSIVSKILETLDLDSKDTVLEIGAGSGVLTLPISEKVKEVIAVEIDKRFCFLLSANNIKVINKDILKLDLSGFPKETKIVSNLPYYITTPVITKLVDKFDFMVIMMQEEVARRIVAEPGNKIYGSISVYVQFHYDVKIIKKVSKNCFTPVPQVDSSIVAFKKKKAPHLDIPKEFLFKVVRKSFSERRKMLRNTLKSLGIRDNMGIDIRRRPETLSVNEFITLAESLWQCQK